MNNKPTKKILKKFEEYLKEFDKMAEIEKVSPNVARTVLVSYEMIFTRVPVLVFPANYQMKSDEARQLLATLSAGSNKNLKNLAQLLGEIHNKNPEVKNWGQEFEKIAKRMDPHRDFLDNLAFRTRRGVQMLFTLFLLDRLERHFARFLSKMCTRDLGVTNDYFNAVLKDEDDSLMSRAVDAEYSIMSISVSAVEVVDAEIDMQNAATHVQNMIRDMFAPIVVRSFVSN